jgi:hypothetical protein
MHETLDYVSAFRFPETNLDSVNLCTNKEISMEMWKSEISMEIFLTGTRLTESRFVPEIEIRKRNHQICTTNFFICSVSRETSCGAPPLRPSRGGGLAVTFGTFLINHESLLQGHQQ